MPHLGVVVHAAAHGAVVQLQRRRRLEVHLVFKGHGAIQRQQRAAQ